MRLVEPTEIDEVQYGEKSDHHADRDECVHIEHLLSRYIFVSPLACSPALGYETFCSDAEDGGLWRAAQSKAAGWLVSPRAARQ